MTFLPHLADMVLNRPLLIMPEKAAVILEVLSGRIGVEASQIDSAGAGGFDASRFIGSRDGGRQGALPYSRTSDGVAIVTVTGSLVNRGAWIGASSGLTSYEGLKHQLDQVAADDKVKRCILDIESPGGSATGCIEAAAAVRALDAKKPVVAVVNGMACSAAYAIASGARRIVSTPTGVSGSIGVVLLHVDYSKALDKAGVTPTFIFAGARKVDGNPYEPLSKGVKSNLQDEVDRFYDLFVSTVAQGRKGLTEKAIRGTEARTFIGQAAKDAGLVDDIGTFEDALADRALTTTYFSGATIGARAEIADLGVAASLPLASLPVAASLPAVSIPAPVASAPPPAPNAALPVAVSASIPSPPQQANTYTADDLAGLLNKRAGFDDVGGSFPSAPAPKQAGAVPWANVAAQINRSHQTAADRRAWIAAELTTDPVLNRRPKQAGAISPAELITLINQENGF